MANKISGKNYRSTGLICFIIGGVFAFFDIPFVTIIAFIASIFFVLYGNWIMIDEQTKQEYNEFVYSSVIKMGMTIEQVKEILNGQPFVTEHNMSALENGICPTCGGKVANGTCTYCGNVYSDESDVLILTYSCKYGKKAYKFKNGILNNIYTHAKPIENFLILNLK